MSYFINGSFSASKSEIFDFDKYFTLLNKISIKSQNGKIPVPPLIKITFP